ncbi:MAG TPA: class I SAM-dependent methyltransferase [Planctomycetes bacterium]|nr:class I SAM-dependent methyltransferase [Planctomycetota bacterium]
MEPTAYRQFLELERTHWWFRGRRTVYFGLLAHELAGERPARVLDLGCGNGGFLPGLAEIADRVFPSDISAESLVHCADRGFPGGVVSSGYALPYADESFDLVCMFDAIEHIEDDQRVLREVARILKPGGRILVTVPAYQFLYANNDRIAQHYRRYDRPMLRRIFAGADLQVRRITHTNVFLFPLILPTVLALKVVERLFPRKLDPDHTNLSWPVPAFVQNVLHGIFAAELPFSKRFDWPAGSAAAGPRPRSCAPGTVGSQPFRRTGVSLRTVSSS